MAAIKQVTVDSKQLNGFTKEQFLKDLDSPCPISDNIHTVSPIELAVEEITVPIKRQLREPHWMADKIFLGQPSNKQE